MTRSMRIEMAPSVPQHLSKNQRAARNWRTVRQATKNAREAAYGLVLEQLGCLPAEPLFRLCTVDITQFWCGKPLDADGLAAGCAAWIDGIVDARVMPDDSPLVVQEYRLHWQRVRKMSERKIVIEIQEVQQ